MFRDASHLLSRLAWVATSASLDAEALYSARGPAEYEQLWADRRIAYEYLLTDDDHWQTALGAQRALARLGQHRAVGVADLLTAALAAVHRLTVVHYDVDFETAAEVFDVRAPMGIATRERLKHIPQDLRHHASWTMDYP
jgi:predicted nucleic acid-binding protein